MSKRVLIAGLFHETHTFLDGTTSLADFSVLRGPELLACKGDSSPLGGVLESAERFGWEVLPTVDYRAQPSAIVEDAVLASFWREFVEHLPSPQPSPELSHPQSDLPDGRGSLSLGHTSHGEDAAPSPVGCNATTEDVVRERDGVRVDAIYLVLHGAMVTQSIDDVEGAFMQRIRSIPALANTPIFGVFDLHATITPWMILHSDCLVGYRENPHTDAREAACSVAGFLQRSFESGVWPEKLGWRFNLIWPPTATATASDPMKRLCAMAREFERDEAIWSISIVAGFAFADTEFTGVGAVAVGTDLDKMIECLTAIHDEAHQLRELGNVTEPTFDQLLPTLRDGSPGLTVLVEPSDNIGGGAPGDGTGLLRHLIEHGFKNAAVCIADPAAVALAQLGGPARLSIGGKGSRLDPGPVELDCEVLSTSEGRFELVDKQSHLASMCGDHFDMGACAVVRHAGITILLTSVKCPPFDLGQWFCQGIDPAKLDFIVVKAGVAHRRAYDPIAARMFWVDTPGPCSSNLKALPYRKLRRPIYPLDPIP